MQKNKLNNVIVLKELSSNIVEEAIVVLKPHVNLKSIENIKKNSEKSLKDYNKKENKQKTIIKEAEYVIEQYILHIQTKNKQKEKDKIEKKYQALKKTSIVLILLNIFLLIKIF